MMEPTKRQRGTPGTSEGVSASLALQCSDILRNVALSETSHSDVEALTRYVERHAVPALAKHVLYSFYGRVSEPDGQYPASGYDDDHDFDDRWAYRSDEGYVSEDEDDPLFKDYRLRKEMKCAIDVTREAYFDKHGNVPDHMHFTSRENLFPGFAGYAVEAADGTFEDYCRRLPGRVRKTLTALPAERIRKIRVYLEIAHGADVDALPENVSLAVATPVVLVDVYYTVSAGVSSSKVWTPAFLPAFETGDPKPITASICAPCDEMSRDFTPSISDVCHCPPVSKVACSKILKDLQASVTVGDWFRAHKHVQKLRAARITLDVVKELEMYEVVYPLSKLEPREANSYNQTKAALNMEANSLAAIWREAIETGRL